MSTIPVRVLVLDTWDEFPFDLPADTGLTELKRRALAAAHVTSPPDGYEIKFRGALLPEGDMTLGGAGVVPNGALIVLPRRRRPAR
jgi:hypothetical protein